MTTTESNVDPWQVQRWTRYAMKIECRGCGDVIFHHEEDARAMVEHILSISDVVRDAESFRDALSWTQGEGKYCDYCDHMLHKDD